MRSRRRPAPTCTWRRSRCSTRARRPARRFARSACATRRARSSSRSRRRTGRSTRRPSRTCGSTRATSSSGSAPQRSWDASRICSRPAGPLAPDPVTRLAEALGPGVELERPSDPSHGDYATNAALKLAGTQRRPPRELAAELAVTAEKLPYVERAEIAGPGFVNLFLADEWFAQTLGEILDAGTALGAGFAGRSERVQVEMVSANPTGPITVAAARNGAYGDAVARILAFGGHDVSRQYYYHGAGAEMERFRESVDAARRGEDPPEDGYRGEYVKELAAEPGDPVPEMRASIERSMERFRIHFDHWALQSELEKRLPELLPRIDSYEQDGALWARSSAYGDEQDWVIVRSAEKGGTPTYRAADIVYLTDKLDRGFDRAVYVLGADHHATARWYGAIARMLGYDPARIEVLLYQFVHLTSGGEAAKASKRAGNVVFLDELMDEIGVDASRWYLVNRGPDQTIEIDLDLASEKSAKNPVYYVQYAHARIAAILRNAGASGELVLSQPKL